MIHVRILPMADQDIDEAADGYVEQAGVDLGLRFLVAVDRTWTALAEFPLVGLHLHREERVTARIHVSKERSD